YPIAVCVSGKPQITIAWNKLYGATSYSVFRLQKPQTTWLTRWSKIPGEVEVDKYVVTNTTYEYQVKAYFSNGTTYSNIVTVKTPSCTTPTAPPPTPTTTPPISNSNETAFTAYITGYGWPDNTPPSANISNPVVHQSAGGTGTYADPITIA